MSLRPLFALLPVLMLWLPGASAAANAGGDELQRALRAQPEPIHGAQLYGGCTACHGTDGGGESNGSVPRIAGQYAGVLIKQLVDFRYGRRWDLRMEAVANAHHLVDAQAIADVAGYAAALQPVLPAAIGNGEDLDRGAVAFLRHCGDCHGAVGQGSAQQRMPRLAGQHATYLVRQMQESAGDGRPNMAPRHRALLNRLDVSDYRGMADYLARMSPNP